MRVAISATAASKDAQVSPVFGRCNYFVIMDTDTGEMTSLQNPAQGAFGGAGVQSAQMVVQQGVQAVISGNLGPNAKQVLDAAGIEAFVGDGLTIAEAMAALEAGELGQMDRPSVSKDFGKGGARPFGGRGRGRQL